MVIGVPKEIKNHDYGVSLTPRNTHELFGSVHQPYLM